MDPSAWKEAKQLFLAARDLPRDEREAFLQAEGGERRQLVERVRGWLVEEEGEFLDTPALGDRFSLGALDAAPERLASAAMPKRIGPFEIRGVVGVGGMGIVYRAEQDTPAREVALKVLRPGVATPAMMRRFEHEAELLGRLDHPGIARIFEAGTADEGEGAQPWLAMELVDGVSLTEHVERERLGARERLALMAEVADAIQHAHQMGVIHRDLKPANLLVESNGHPKVLDFGVARPTADEHAESSWRTAFGQLVGTLPYMSPEQVSGDPERVDTRTDVYALGAVTYELLSGDAPIDLAGLPVPEAARAVDERDPRPLSESCPGLGRDVCTIVEKALEKRPDRRYASAAALAADLRHYLADEPITARPPSTIEQLRRFARKNHVLVGWAGATLLALVLGILGTTSGWLRTIEARDDAAHEAERAGAVRDYLVDLLQRADPVREGGDVPLRDVLVHAASELDDVFAEQPLILGDLRHALGKTFWSLGEFEASEEQLREALRLRTRHAGELHRETLGARGDLGTVLMERGKIEDAIEHLRETWKASEAALGETDRVALSAQHNLGLSLFRAGRFDEAHRVSTSCLALKEATLGRDDPDTVLSRMHLARLIDERCEVDEAVTLHEACLTDCVRVFGIRHPRTLTQRNNLALALGRVLDYDRSLELLEENLLLRRDVLGNDHPDTVESLGNLASIHGIQNRFHEALDLSREAYDTRRRLLGDHHPRTLISANNVAECLKELGRSDEAEALYHSVVESATQSLPNDHWHLSLYLGNLGRFLWEEARFDEAEPYLLECYDGLLDVFGDGHPRVEYHEERLVSFYRAWGNPAEAEFWGRVGEDD